MSLTGQLEVFPLEEVLRLLARSKKTGCLRVESGQTRARLFLAGGGLALATTMSDDDLRHHLMAAGLLTEEGIARVDLHGSVLLENLAPGATPAGLTDFLREEMVESLFRVRRSGTGTFDFVVDLTPRYPTGQSFDAEVAVAESDRRAVEWGDIERVVPDLSVPYKMAPEIGEQNGVTVSPATWRILAALEAGANVRMLSNRLGVSDFRAAREVAGLVRARLVSPAAHRPAAPAPAEAVAAAAVPAPGEVAAAPWFEQVSEPAPAAAAAAPAPASEWEQTPAIDESWFEPSSEPAALSPEAVAAAEAALGEVPEALVTERAEEDLTRGWWSDAMGQPKKADDADRFLESVFSQLSEESEEKAADETGFGMGLLRRRRLGSISRDLNEPGR